jgi:protein XagA
LRNGVPSGEVISTSTFANNTEYTGIGLELNYKVSKRMGISVGAAGAFSGKIIMAAPAYTAGIFFEL